MLNQKFYHSTIRKAIVAFGNLFNSTYIDRRDGNGNVVQTIKVPLLYSTTQKFIAIIEAQPVAETQSSQTLLPRMGFEMTGIAYDPARRVSLVQQNRTVNSSSTSMNAQYAPTPYNIAVSLYIYAKTQDDGLQIVEQILPFFNPDFNLTLNTIPELGIKNDMAIILESVNYEDQYGEDFKERRAIIWTLNFTLKCNFYGPISKQSIIKSVNVDLFKDVALTEQIHQYDVTVDPTSSVPGSTFTFDETFKDF